MKKKKIEKPKDKYKDYVFLDIHASNEKSVIKNIRENSNFTINAAALQLKEVTSKNWQKKIICLPNTLKDLKEKKIRVNSTLYPANIFSCLRLMSKGFKKPSKKDIEKLLNSLSRVSKPRFQRNVQKLFGYAGGEKKARKLAEKLGVKQDIFNFKTVKQKSF